MDFASLLSFAGWLGFLLASFTISLWVIVAIHEFGHYIVARWSGIRADVFSIGMGPTLVSRVDKRGTIWRIALYPIGGYVKFKGDANASSFSSDQKTVLLRDSFAGAPLWARSATVAAGPAFNFISAAIIFAGIIHYQGVNGDIPVISDIKPAPYAVQELVAGDRILGIDGIATATTEELVTAFHQVEPAAQVNYRVQRGVEVLDLVAPHPGYPVLMSVMPDSPARAAGFKAGDVLLRADGLELPTLTSLRDKIEGSDGSPVTVEYWRNGQEIVAVLSPLRRDMQVDDGFESRMIIGVTSEHFFVLAKDYPGPMSALGKGFTHVGSVIKTTFDAMASMVTGAISTCNIAGPVGMATISSHMASDGFQSFLYFVAVLSVAVGFFNLLPIPVLDGGHLAFHAWEAVTGRQPNPKIAGLLLKVGVFLILSLMVFALAHDLLCP